MAPGAKRTTSHGGGPAREERRRQIDQAPGSDQPCQHRHVGGSQVPAQDRTAGSRQGGGEEYRLQSCRGLDCLPGWHLADDEKAQRIGHEQPRTGTAGKDQPCCQAVKPERPREQAQRHAGDTKRCEVKPERDAVAAG
jgi:hypothetical protein